MEENRTYFAYGANINKDSMAHRCPKAKEVGTIILRNWELLFFNHATIEFKTGSMVAGALWELTPDCERSLDLFEGYPDYYVKKSWSQDGHEFFFYQMAGFKRGSPSLSYVQNIAEGYKQWNLPTTFLIESLHL
jgi:gamma-glutamylcyclotransferase (GGCT)/AIG2-like uncharacterized protein YtfP